MRKIIKVSIYVILLSAVLFISGCNSNDQTQSVNSMNEVQEKSTKETITFKAVVSGTNTYNVTGLSSGIVEEVDVKVGDDVKKGDRICKLNTDSLQLEYDSVKEKLDSEKAISKTNIKKYKDELDYAIKQRELKLKQINNEIKNIKSEYKINSKNYTKYNRKLKSEEAALKKINKMVPDKENEDQEQLINQQENYSLMIEHYSELCDSYKENMNNCKNKQSELESNYKLEKIEQDELVNDAKYNLETYVNDKTEEYQSKLESLELEIKNAVILCEENGIVTEILVEKGQAFEGGKVAVLSDDSNFIVKGYIPQTDIFKVSKGMKALIKPDYDQSTEIEGVISKIIEVYDDENAGFPIEITIPLDNKLKIGIKTKVKIEVEMKSE